MKSIVFLTLVVTMLPNPRFWAQNSSANDPIRLTLPTGFESTNCRFEYFLIGLFGGYGGVARPALKAAEFEIETVHEGTPVERSKAVLYCSGYQVQTVAFDSLPAVGRRTFQLNPKPLGTVSLVGVVRGLTSQEAQALYVDVDYTPSWVCEFFALPDCLLGRWRIASGKLDADGKFTALLPDLARDAVINSFKNPGELSFRIRDRATGNTLFELKPVGRESAFGRIPVANGYPSVQVFDAGPPK